MFGFTELELRTYLILVFCMGLQVLINQIEEPYARSLIHCEVPVNATLGAEPSGSGHCGDRLYVIGEGAKLSGSGQSLENVGRFVITLFVSGFADSHGRKAATLVGWCCILASVVCFFLASFLRTYAVPLFIAAQGLQGMSGIGLMLEIVTGDIAQQVGDTVAVYSRRDMMGMFLGIIFFGMVLGIQYAAITEFMFVWAAVVAFSVVILVLLIAVFPETQAEDEQRQEHTALKDVILNELRDYRRFMTENRFIKFTVAASFFDNMSGGISAIIMPWIMAYNGYTQLELMVRGMPMIVVGLPLMPLVPWLCKKCGHRATWNLCYLYDKVLNLAFLPFLQLDWGLPMLLTLQYCKLPINGFGSVVSSVSVRIVGVKINAKFQAMNQINGFLCGSFSSLMYSRVFSATATHPLAILSPMIISSAFSLVSMAVYWRGHREIVLGECDKLTAEAKEAEGKEAEGKEAEKPQEEKKTD
mmetsp:Transcript_73944/g.190828  ORF Transcript_73944/g.190828 Transcript_73944/m.190828 type:complete len:472 (+) Transcript_73944:106-1521(+)